MQLSGNSFTTSYDDLSRILCNDIMIEPALNAGGLFKVVALWDTGAGISLIRPEVAKNLNLLPISKMYISTPTDEDVPTNVYLVNFYLPNRLKIPNVMVVEGIPSECDVLIGMDVIGLGDFAVSNYNGKTMFSFRMPSMAEIDFVKHSYLSP
jgi:predicted aspartyl protease